MSEKQKAPELNLTVKSQVIHFKNFSFTITIKVPFNII